MITGHGGNIHDVAKKLGCAPSDIMDMSSNINPIGPMPGLLKHLEMNLKAAVGALPQADAAFCIDTFAARHGLDADRVLAANGTTQFIYTLPRVLNTEKALVLAPTYSDYGDACLLHEVKCDFFITDSSNGFIPDMDKFRTAIETADTIFICNPNNPTGVLLPQKALLEICETFPAKRFVIDESYLPFVDKAAEWSLLNCGLDNLLVLTSLSKIFRIPGLRVGFLTASKGIIDRMSPFLMPWSVNSLAQQAIVYLMSHKNEVDTFIDTSRRFLAAERDFILQSLTDIKGIRLYPSTTSFLLAELDAPHTAAAICNHLLEKRILLRNCDNFMGLSDRFFRISIKDRQANGMLIEALVAFLD